MNAVFLYNKQSGKGKIFKKIDYIKKTLNKAFSSLEVYSHKSKEEMIFFLNENVMKYDYLIFAGGDGTFNAIINIIARKEKKPILGYIPSGTCNDIAHNLKIPKNIKKALKIITQNNIIKSDIGKANDKYFMYVCAAGTFTDVSYKTKQFSKKALGKLAYALNGLHEVFFPLSESITFKRETYEEKVTAPLILIMNSIHVGGFPFNKGGCRNDGTFDVMIVKDGKGKGIYNIISLFLCSLLKIKSRNMVLIKKESSFDIICSKPVSWCIDGEEGPVGSIHIENIPKSIEILVPCKKN